MIFHSLREQWRSGTAQASAAAACAALMVACAGTATESAPRRSAAPESDAQANVRTVVEGPLPESPPVGPPVPEEGDDTPPRADAVAEESDPDEAVAEGAGERDRFRRADGRPSWWIESPRRERGRVTIAVEALAPDLRSARRAAVDAGLAQLRSHLGREPREWSVQAATVQPLRAARGPETMNRFVGYVLISAQDD